jgi:hypothetical protein
MAKRKKAAKRAPSGKGSSAGKKPAAAKRKPSRKRTPKKRDAADQTVTLSVPLEWKALSKKAIREIVDTTLGQRPDLRITHVIVEASEGGICAGVGELIWDKFG